VARQIGVERSARPGDLLGEVDECGGDAASQDVAAPVVEDVVPEGAMGEAVDLLSVFGVEKDVGPGLLERTVEVDARHGGAEDRARGGGPDTVRPRQALPG
jgi:hypothetical protein